MRTRITKLVVLTATLLVSGSAWAGACGDTVRNIQGGNWPDAADSAVGCIRDVVNATKGK